MPVFASVTRHLLLTRLSGLTHYFCALIVAIERPTYNQLIFQFNLLTDNVVSVFWPEPFAFKKQILSDFFIRAECIWIDNSDFNFLMLAIFWHHLPCPVQKGFSKLINSYVENLSSIRIKLAKTEILFSKLSEWIISNFIFYKKNAPTFSFEREKNVYIPLFLPLKSISIIPLFLYLNLCVLRSIVVLN